MSGNFLDRVTELLMSERLGEELSQNTQYKEAIAEEERIFEILSLIVPSVFKLFQCQIIATKIPPFASERKLAILRLGFVASEEKLIGHDKEFYTDYYVLQE